MKRLIFMLCMLAPMVTSAQSDWFVPSKVGTQLRYAVYNQDGTITSYMTTTTDSVTLTADSTWIVHQRSTLYNARNQPTGAVLYSESRISNDTTYLAINRISNNSGARVRTWGTLVALPPTITPSTTFANQSLDCTVRYAGMTFNATTNINDISLMNYETLTVDNRIYNTIKLSYNTSTRVLGRNEQSFVTTWIAKQVGIMLVVVDNQQSGESTTTKLIGISEWSGSTDQ